MGSLGQSNPLVAWMTVLHLILGIFFILFLFIFGMMDVARGTLIPLHARTDVDVAAAVAASASASAGNVAFT